MMRGQPTDLLELFFDLALIASLTLASKKMANEDTWTGMAQALLALSTLWAVWVTTTSFTDLYSPQERPVQLVILGIMFGGMLMSAALPDCVRQPWPDLRRHLGRDQLGPEPGAHRVAARPEGAGAADPCPVVEHRFRHPVDRRRPGLPSRYASCS
ncbi:low temperature requirement protein A [Micromonospora sp. IBHARD004]|uniref:low temperature requirement protein A n=1 Tax=Micromonospora sp. IBHARD004 TaxID=3457764 RepID=UPI004059248B